MEITGIDETNRDFFSPILFTEDRESTERLIETGVIEGGKPIAAASLAVDFGERSARLLSIYTIEKYRRKSAAKQMLSSLVTVAQALNTPRLDVYYTDAMDGVDELLLHSGFDTFLRGEQETYLLSDIKKHERIRGQLGRKTPFEVSSFAQLTASQKNDIDMRMAQYRLGRAVDVPNDSLSFVAISNGSPIAVMLCDTIEPAIVPTVMVELIATFGTDVRAIMSLFSHSFQTFDVYGIKAVTFYAANPKISVIVKSVTEGQKGQRLKYGVKFF